MSVSQLRSSRNLCSRGPSCRWNRSAFSAISKNSFVDNSGCMQWGTRPCEAFRKKKGAQIRWTAGLIDKPSLEESRSSGRPCLGILCCFHTKGPSHAPGSVGRSSSPKPLRWAALGWTGTLTVAKYFPQVAPRLGTGNLGSTP